MWFWFAFLFLKNNFTEAYFAYHIIYPFQVYRSVILFSKFTRLGLHLFYEETELHSYSWIIFIFFELSIFCVHFYIELLVLLKNQFVGSCYTGFMFVKWVTHFLPNWVTHVCHLSFDFAHRVWSKSKIFLVWIWKLDCLLWS